MERSPFLPLPEGMVIGQVEITAAQLTVEVISTQPFARCPTCGSLSDHVHCQYQRLVERNLSLESCSLIPTLGGSRKHLLVTVVIPT